MLAKAYTDEPKPLKDKPEQEVLNKLLEACKSFDIDAVDTAIAELGAYEYETDNEFVVEILDSAEQFDFAKIIERLEK
jgi:hypothetical protein